jgi:hypothetical protein
MLVRSVHVAVEQEGPHDLVWCIEDTELDSKRAELREPGSQAEAAR